MKNYIWNCDKFWQTLLHAKEIFWIFFFLLQNVNLIIKDKYPDTVIKKLQTFIQHCIAINCYTAGVYN